MRTSGLMTMVTLAAFVASCTGTKPTSPARPAGSAAPRVDAVALSGTVKLLAAPAISDNGAGAISDNGAGIISNNSGAVIANNGGGVLSDHGLGLVGKSKRSVLQAGKPRAFLLADAVVSVTDAAGKPVLDAAGKPLQAVTDAKGAYRLDAKLPASNLVLHVKLHEGGELHGGELAALLVRGAGANRAIDTASSLGATYVLQQFVHGDQPTLDKLPATAAAKLDGALADALTPLAKAPGYRSDEQVQLADSLRAQAPAVESVFQEVKALLLGQAKLGAGRKATEVALGAPFGLVLDPAGNAFVMEDQIGRIRKITPAGTIETFADPVRGTVRASFVDALDLARAPDGSFYVASYGLIHRIAPDGTVTVLAGDAKRRRGPVDVPGRTTQLSPLRIALGPDGTLYVGEEQSPDHAQAGRILSIGTDGVVHLVDFPIPASGAGTDGIAVAPDGTLYVLYRLQDGTPGKLYRKLPGQPVTVLAEDLPPASDLALGPDGMLYVSDKQQGALLALDPATGLRKVVAGAGAPADRAGVTPGSVAVAADNTIYLTDADNGLVYRLPPGAPAMLIAGATLSNQGGTDLRNVALNTPVGAAFDAAGRLLITETGSRSIVRFDGKALARLSAGGRGVFQDGLPLAATKFGNPNGIAVYGDEIYVVDGEAQRLIKVAANGTVTTVVGPGTGTVHGIEPGQRLDAGTFDVSDGGLAVDAQGRAYLTRNYSYQVFRLAADHKIELVAGAPPSIWGSAQTADPANVLGLPLSSSLPAGDARFLRLAGVAVDSTGAVFVADFEAMVVYKVTGLDTPKPTIARYAGIGITRMLADPDVANPLRDQGANALDAALFVPLGVAVDAHDNLFVTEAGSTNLPATYIPTGFDLGTLPQATARVRRITPDGKISTVAGPGGKLLPDPLADDALSLPVGIAVSADGRLAIVDPGANLVHLLPAGSY